MQYKLIGCLAGALHASVNVSFVELGLALVSVGPG
jgi:hypothetical protein